MAKVALIVELVGVGRKNAVLGVSYFLLLLAYPLCYIFRTVMTNYVSYDEWRGLLAVGLVLVSVIAGVFYVE